MIERIADGRTDLVVDLLAAGAPATAKDEHGVSLIQWCAYHGDVAAIRYLLSNGEQLDSLGDNLDLNGAVFHGHASLVEFLIEEGADVNHPLPDSGEAPLHAALCKIGRPELDEVLELLLDAGANPNVATKHGVETGAFMRDVRTKGETPLHRAAAFGSERAITLHIEEAPSSTPATCTATRRSPGRAGTSAHVGSSTCSSTAGSVSDCPGAAARCATPAHALESSASWSCPRETGQVTGCLSAAELPG